MATDPVLHSVRDYYWGCIYCEGPGEYTGDYGHLTGGGPFFAVEDQVTIEVVNSRMVEPEDADVELNVHVRTAPVASADHASVIVLRSGVLSIGDADHFDEIPLRPGRWLVQVDLDSRGPDGARWVNVHLSPEDAP
ncbi:hypothetical protein ABZ249_31155 [Nocardiopsis sp. NPDC006139]|uniref:hypothetical protein n=1 Tax=unclassified Nocardiopsis TaxID=2649073 RepID=UPI0033A26659